MELSLQESRKPGWPLLLTAICSFIPGLGLVFGAIAVTWGLVSERRRAKLAVAIGAAGALLNVGGALLIEWMSEGSDVFSEALVESTRQDLTRLVSALEDQRARTGEYPPTLPALTGKLPIRVVNIYDRSGGLLSKPRLYEYHLAENGNSYDLFSAGPDGIPSTADDIRPVLPDSEAAESGYRPGTAGGPS